MTTTRAIHIVKSPLGGDKLLFRRMTAYEHLGRLFQFDLEIFSKDDNIKLDDVLGQSLTVALDLGNGKERYFNGYVAAFSYLGSNGDYAVYTATLRPWLWFLTRTADCRIFQNKKVPDIIKQIFKDHGFSDIEDSLSASYGTREYQVQYRETDFNFISRLMEEEGIYYYFTHDKGKHTLVLADSYKAHETYPGYGDIPFFPLANESRRERDHIHTWQVSRQIQPGLYALNDYDFKKPNSDLKVSAKISRGHSHPDAEIYDYPGNYINAKEEGDAFAKVRIEEQQAEFELSYGAGNARGIMAGALFKLTQYPRNDQNREYLVVTASHELSSQIYDSGETGDGPTYSCTFTAMPSSEAYRSPSITPKPIVQGMQTAVVVGKSGEEIDTDEYGRIKVQFHWDRYGKKDENSSCWVRVATSWAGKQWGSVHIPRIGQEVVVSFLEGDPDKPLITGSVYNADNMPPYELPGSKTQSGIKSRSTKSGTAENFNEIRFEDLKGSEEVYIHAEKDMNRVVENDETHDVGHNRSVTVGNDETISIGNNRSETVGKNETVSIGENRTHDIGKDEAVSIGNNRSENVGKDETISIGNNRSENVAKDESISIGGQRQTQVSKDDQLQIGKNWLVDAGDKILLQVGSASISMSKNGDITIKGNNITIQGSANVNVKASSNVVIKGSKVTQN